MTRQQNYKNLICKLCGKSFTSQSRNTKQNYCSRDCGDIVRAKKAEYSPYWKGINASYSAKHIWLSRHAIKNGKCEKCGKVCKTDWANLSGNYYREIWDWRELCRSCHMKYDKRQKAIKVV